MKPEDIDYINTHGTSTPLGDIAEVKAITEVFGDHAYELNISSTKSMTGHCLGAAGVIEAIACIMSVIDEIFLLLSIILPTTRNWIPGLNLPLIRPEKNCKSALSNTFGFGGHNAACDREKIY